MSQTLQHLVVVPDYLEYESVKNLGEHNKLIKYRSALNDSLITNPHQAMKTTYLEGLKD